jgi:hypothetical protein
MEVAIARVEDVADDQVVLLGDLANVLQHAGDLAARHYAVLRVVGGLTRPSAANAILRPFHNSARSSSVLARRTSRAFWRMQTSLTATACSSTASRSPSNSISNTAPASSGKPAWQKASMVRNVQPSSISSAAGVMPTAVMAETVRAASSTDSKTASSVATCSGFAQQLHRDRRGDADRSLRADEESREIVAIGFGSLAAEVHDLAAGQHHFDSRHMIDGDAVQQRVRPAGILRNVAADGASFLAGRIGREVQPEMRDMFRQLQVDDARLHHGARVLHIDLEDAVHARECNDETAGLGNRAAAQSGTCATPDHGNVVRRGQAHNLRNLLGVRRKDDGAWSALADSRVVLVQHHVFRTVKNSVAANNFAEIVKDSRQVHGSTASV